MSDRISAKRTPSPPIDYPNPSKTLAEGLPKTLTPVPIIPDTRYWAVALKEDRDQWSVGVIEVVNGIAIEHDFSTPEGPGSALGRALTKVEDLVDRLRNRRGGR